MYGGGPVVRRHDPPRAGIAWGPIALLLGIGGGLAVLTWMREPQLTEAISTHPGVAGEEGRDEYRHAA